MGGLPVNAIAVDSFLLFPPLKVKDIFLDSFSQHFFRFLNSTSTCKSHIVCQYIERTKVWKTKYPPNCQSLVQGRPEVAQTA